MDFNRKYLFLGEKPFKLDVFEDTIYLSTLHTHNIMRLDKFNRTKPYYLVQGLPRMSHLLIIQEHKQDRTCKYLLKQISLRRKFCQ